LVEKLVLTILPHPQPYKLQWLNDGEHMIVNQQVDAFIFQISVPLLIAKDENEF